MKRFTIMAALAAATVIPAMSYTKALVGYETEDKIEKGVYTYNEDNKVVEILRRDSREPDMDYIVRVEYDELGREIKSYLYQDMFMTGSDDYNDLAYIAYVDLTYNDKGQVCERRNYNNWGVQLGVDDWTLGGIMKYYYNEDGKYSKVEVWLEIPGRDQLLMQQDDYTYDPSGRLILRETQLGDYSGNVALSNYSEYEYDEEGRLVKQMDWERNAETGNMENSGFRSWSYTEAGDLLDINDCSASGRIQQQMSFYYPMDGNYTSASDVVFPYEFDEADTNELYSMFTSAPNGYDLRAININTDQLVYVATYEYEYKDFGTNGVKNVALENGVSVMAYGAGKYKLSGVADGQLVRVYAADGSHAADIRYNGTLDLSGLASGSYIVAAKGGAVKVRR